jgi:RND family efflux transporter MFP subunit
MNTENQIPQLPISDPLAEQSPAVQPPVRRRILGVIRHLSGQGVGFVRRMDWRIVGPVLVLTGSMFTWRAVTVHAKADLKPMPALQFLPVAVARVSRQDLYNELTIPAEFRPYLQVELHAKVSGYVQQINVDIGDRVKAGQLLAKLEVPELKDELDRAIAAEQKAEADYMDAHLVYTRLLAVNKEHPNLVAQQDLDSAEARDRTTTAAIAGAKAEVERYQTLESYTRITAPFDGVVTRRYADPGSLIQAGTASDTQSMPLVRLSDNYHLRLDFDVSVAYVKDIELGDPVEVRVESLGDKAFTGKISRSTLKVDDLTRTMIAEIEVANPKLELVPGMYASVVLKVQRRPQALCIPTEAVSGGKKETVYVVNPSQEIEERPVKLGLETPDKFEVASGLTEGDLVTIGNRSRVKPGQKVVSKLIGPVTQQ